jgi:hypothetical protein
MVKVAESHALAQTDVAVARPKWWPDALVAVVLGLTAFLYRAHFPADGFFYDDGWQAFGAIKGSFSQFITVGQPQPGFGLELMVWTRIFGDGTVSVITPALIAGAIGPPALYLVLRRFGVARSIAALLGAALAVCTAHIVYSGRVKVYTSDVIVVLLVASVLPWLARRSWRLSTAAGWFVGATLLAGFSSFAMVASVAAAIILVLHPRGDLRWRIGAVAAQAVGVLVVLEAESRTHSQQALADFFVRYDAYVPATLNPATFVRETFHHLTRITAAFPGGPAWFTVVCLLAAAIGLGIAAARGGARGIAARFMIAMVLIAFVGSVAQQVPFGPTRFGYRMVLWMTPIVAFGIAVVLQRARGEIARRGSSWKRAFDTSAFVVAGLVLLTGLATQPPYPEGGAAAASRLAMERLGPRDALVVTPGAMMSFALDSGAPVRFQAAPHRDVGIVPKFDDQRIYLFMLLTKLEVARLDRVVGSADRVVVVDSGPDLRVYQQYRARLATELQRRGFEVESTTDVNRAFLNVWHRRP